MGNHENFHYEPKDEKRPSDSGCTVSVTCGLLVLATRIRENHDTAEWCP